MSSVDDQRLEMNRRQIEQARQEEMARRLRLAQARAERAREIERQVQAEAAAAGRREARARRQMTDALDRQRQVSSDLGSRAREGASRLDGVDRRLEQARSELRAAEGELRDQVREATRLQSAASETLGSLSRGVEQAEAALHQAGTVGWSVLRDAETVAVEGVETRAGSGRLQALEGEIHRLESELKFVSQRSDLAPAAMVTLMAMEQSGFELAETKSRGGLIAYFRKAGEAHELAVRLSPPPAGNQETERSFELLSESFHTEGSECLALQDDFQTCVQATGLADLVQMGRIYPKDEGSVRVGRRGVLPRPKRRRSDAGRKRTSRTRDRSRT